jgi:hypothetical protein
VAAAAPATGEAADVYTGHKLAPSRSPPLSARDQHRAVPADLLTGSPGRRAASLAASRNAARPALRRTVLGHQSRAASRLRHEGRPGSRGSVARGSRSKRSAATSLTRTAVARDHHIRSR